MTPRADAGDVVSAISSAGIAVILCTSFGGDIAQAKAEEAGNLAKLAKPVGPEELLRSLAVHLRPGR